MNRLCVIMLLVAVAGCATRPPPAEEGAPKAKKPGVFSASVTTVTLEDVPLGVPVGLRLPNGGYYALMNDSDKPVTAVVTAVKPSFCQRTPGAPAYRPIDDAGWVTVEPKVLTIPANAESEVAVTVQLPDKPELRGQHLEFWLRAGAVKGGMGSVALYSRVRLNVAAASTEFARETPRAPVTREIAK